MRPNNKYKNLGLEFWANIKLLNQRLGYAERKTKKNLNPGFVVPTVDQILQVFKDEKLNPERLVKDHKLTEFGILLQEYMQYRGDVLTNDIEPNLMNKDEAKRLFEAKRAELKPNCPLPMNKQKGEKRDHAFLTGLVNMLVEANKGEFDCDYDPRELTALTMNKFPVRTLSRRVDGAFPTIVDPKAIWEQRILLHNNFWK